uniref:NADH dehydrogenase [ubiquinone] iron-sulfur protein 6, mitochondrial n=1 Tax=Zosterops lateralis melanops TaxID=1220523 RepID=A0A8D2PLX6_ZOSLA
KNPTKQTPSVNSARGRRALLSSGPSPPGDPAQELQGVYDEKDYRRVRFVGRQKEVNKNFAIDLIAEQPVSQVESRVVSCDGGGGALGHPKVYINLDKETKTGTCGYCGLQFKQKHH